MTKGLRFRVRGVKKAVRNIKSITVLSNRLQRQHIDRRFMQIKTVTFNNTMTATGETKSKIFIESRSRSTGTSRHETGYLPTSNNQSVSAEFGKGNVHTKMSAHFDEGGRPKCSRNPVDLFTFRGGYTAVNRRAKRGALRFAITHVLKSDPGTPVEIGGTIKYEPDLSRLVEELKKITKAVTRHAV